MKLDADLERVRALIAERAGLVFPAARLPDFTEAIARQCTRLRVSAQDLLRVIEHDERALDDLVAELTIGESYFFRDRAQFDFVRREILPALAARDGGGVLRAWSAACAAGEEAYSLAITFAEAGLGAAATVFATDIARPRLGAAEKAVYRRWALRGVSDDEIAAYFDVQADGFGVKREYREHVRFGYLNLAQDVYPSIGTGIWGFDLILCRNVLIYFDRDTVAHVARRLIDSLSDEGWLLIGASDPPLGDFVDCDAQVTAAGLVYRRKRATAVQVAAAAAERELPQLPPRRAAPVKARTYARPAARPRPAPAPAEAAGEDALIAEVRALADRGRFDDALAVIGRGRARFPASPELTYLHGVLHAEQGRLDAAADAARRVLYLDHDFVLGHMLAGDIHRRSGRLAAARRAYGNARRLLAALSPDAAVAAADGENAGRLLEIVELQIELINGAS